MQHGIRIRVAVATLIGGVLVAGCGGSSTSQTAATGPGGALASSVAAGATATAPSRTEAGGAAASSPALAFARCMRANGVTNFPDPSRGGGFEFPAGPGTNPASPTFRAAQAKCRKLLPGPGVPGPGSTTHPTAQTMAKLRRIAVCMRAHGVPQFPDPRTSVPAAPLNAGANVITDFDGAILLFPGTIDIQAPAYRQALTACGAPPLGLPH